MCLQGVWLICDELDVRGSANVNCIVCAVKRSAAAMAKKHFAWHGREEGHGDETSVLQRCRRCHMNQCGENVPQQTSGAACGT
eukprot:363361-Chlamydomonas_euryale.AAC.13